MTANTPPIILTRPAGRGDELVEQLRTVGLSVHVLPLLRLNPLPIPDLSAVKIPDQLIFISPSAADHAMAHLPVTWKQATLLAVGRGTAKQLALLGWPNARVPVHEASEGLLSLDCLSSVNHQHIVIVRGEGGREYLAHELRARGASVQYLEVYSRSGPEPEHVQQLKQLCQKPAIVVVSSGEALNKLCAIIPAPTLKQLSAIVVSDRLQEMADTRFRQVINAGGADTISLRLAIERSVRQRIGRK